MNDASYICSSATLKLRPKTFQAVDCRKPSEKYALLTHFRFVLLTPEYFHIFSYIWKLLQTSHSYLHLLHTNKDQYWKDKCAFLELVKINFT